MTFSERLIELRKTRHLTQKQVYENVGMSSLGYQRYEYGTREPAFQKLLALADYFDVSLDYLVGRTDVPQVYHSYKPNSETIAAMKEAVAISNGTIPTKTFNTVDELMKDLLSDVED